MTTDLIDVAKPDLYEVKIPPTDSIWADVVAIVDTHFHDSALRYGVTFKSPYSRNSHAHQWCSAAELRKKWGLR